jgi:hypothetical protein
MRHSIQIDVITQKATIKTTVDSRVDLIDLTYITVALYVKRRTAVPGSIHLKNKQLRKLASGLNTRKDSSLINPTQVASINALIKPSASMSQLMKGTETQTQT